MSAPPATLNKLNKAQSVVEYNQTFAAMLENFKFACGCKYNWVER